MMVGASGIHWVAPATMLGALLAGITLALVHHAFFSTLAGAKAPSSEHSILGMQVSSQQLNSSIGTAFAFLVNACLTLAVSTAYVQLFWRAAKNNETSKTIGQLDTISSGLSNVFSFWDVLTWRKYPILLLTAILSW
jgi:uncharacterized membrane protein AbrB (regulator of aidB expression)